MPIRVNGRVPCVKWIGAGTCDRRRDLCTFYRWDNFRHNDRTHSAVRSFQELIVDHTRSRCLVKDTPVYGGPGLEHCVKFLRFFFLHVMALIMYCRNLLKAE